MQRFLALACLSTALGASAIPSPSIPDRTFTIIDFRALADGKTDNAKAIQAAIDAAVAAGGGTVVVPGAKKSYLSGPLKLRSHVRLMIERNAVLQMLPYGQYPGVEDFITASKTADVAIGGAGRIDGQGRPWWDAYDATPKSDKARKTMRPKRMIAFDSCTRSEIRDITLSNPPNVHISIHGKSADVTVAGVRIESPEKSHNTDGIDLCGQRIAILDCSIACGDDNIAIGGGATQDVKVSGCKFGVGHGMSIGSHTRGGVKDVRVENCSFAGTHTGIRLKSERDRGGLAENLAYTDLTMTGVAVPIHISSYYGEKEPKRFESDHGEAVTATTPFWRNITVRNVRATGAKQAGILWGLPEAPIESLTLDHVTIQAEKGMKVVHVKGFATDGVKIAVSGKDKEITRYNVKGSEP